MSSATTNTNGDAVSSLSIKELKKELQSYGMLTDSFFDKESLVSAVRSARDSGWKQPTTTYFPAASESTAASSSASSAPAASNKNQGSASSTKLTSSGGSFSVGYPSNKKRASPSTSNKDKPTDKKAKQSNKHRPFNAALAKSWEDQDVRGYFISEKLDGMRALWDGENLYSRNHNIINAPSFFTDALPNNVCLDGELFLERGEFQQCMSIAKQSNANDWKRLTFVVFDAPKVIGDFETRLKAATDALKSSNVDDSIAKILPHVICRGKSHAMEELERVTSLGGEGIMLRHPTNQYKGGRSADLLKKKVFHDAEGIVTDYEEGKGKNEGRMGALVCEMMSNRSKRFKVGTGFCDDEREWENVPPVGSVITYRYFELTKDGKPRFPSFVRVRPSE